MTFSLYRYLIAKDTADDPIWEMLKRKLEFLNDVGLSKDNYNNVNTEVQETLLPSGFSWEQILGDEANWDACDGTSDEPSSKRMRTDEDV
ncbi:hypothetical protein RvY_19409 [Ramazzottius varieornatus]|uniref:Uncharacterized protein n=1 Tax=Ramazzottius varieornatus TaxID=947166 RepID=A0A1D1W9B6_RAMVA|nr:hypothetical protein RvY_19394 [Ramazzottius varieornatus]GAV09940.1 hypothetical protein RvY_19409 [Ramazzottius varieornatus]